MSQVNVTTMPLVSSGGTPPYSYQIIRDQTTTVNATIDANNNLTVDSSAVPAGNYGVKIMVMDSQGFSETQVIPVFVVDNSSPFLVMSDVYCITDNFPTIQSFNVRSYGLNGGLQWSVQGNASSVGITPNPSDPTQATVSFTIYQNGSYPISVSVQDSVGNVLSKTVNVYSKPSKPYRLVNGAIEIDLLSPDVPVSGPGCSVTPLVIDYNGSNASSTLNFTIQEALSDIRIRPYTFDHYFFKGDKSSQVLPIDGNLDNITILPFNAVTSLGMILEVDPEADEVTLSGPPFGFGNSSVFAQMGIVENGVQVCTVGRQIPVASFNGTSDLVDFGSNSVICRPMIIGDFIGLNILQPDFNCLHAYMPSSMTALVAAGSALPPGLSLDQTTGLIYGPLSGPFTGSSLIQFVNDGADVSGTFTITWNILQPAFSLAPALPSSTVGITYAGTIKTNTSANLASASVIWGTPPPGIVFSVSTTDQTSIAVSGIPTTSGYFDITIKATDTNGQSGYCQVRFECLYGELLSILTAILPQAYTGQGFTQQLVARGGITPYTWTVDASTPLPAGMNLSTNGLLNGTPTATSYDTNVIFHLTDSDQNTVSATINLSVTNQIAILNSVLPKMKTNSPYNVTLSAVGGNGPGTYTWSLASGSPALPAGVSLNTISNNVGSISGTPTDLVYSQHVVFQVQDNVGNQTTKSLNLVIDNTGVSLLSIDISGLGVISRGCAYNGNLNAIGGVAPYQWSTTGSLPAGLVLNINTGAIYGSTTATSPVTLTFRVVDAEGAYGSRQVTLSTIQSLAASVTPLPQGRLGVAYSASVGTATSCNSPITWSATGVPNGLLLNSSTGVLSGTPAAAFSGSINVKVMDSINDQATFTSTLVVNASNLMINTTVPLPAAYTGIPYSFTLTATGGVVTPSNGYSWSAISSLPTGFSFSNGTLSCPQVPVSLAGTAPVLKFQVTDALGSTASASFNLVINQSVGLLAGPDYENGISDGSLGTLELASGFTVGSANMTGSMNDWFSRQSDSFLVGAYGLPVSQSSNGVQAYNMVCSNPEFTCVLQNAVNSDPNYGEIFWWAITNNASNSLAAVDGIMNLTFSVTGPGVTTPVSQAFKVYVKTRKTISIVDGNNAVVSDLGNYWS